jgi:uncharacterized protein (TIGR03086 family)
MDNRTDERFVRLERAVAATRAVVAKVNPEQHGDPTPCDAWDVRALLNHLVAGNRYFGALAAGERPEFSLFQEDHLGDADPARNYDAAAATALDAWRSADSLDRAAPLPSGGTGPKIIDMHAVEEFLHGWDLATATGQDRTLDPQLAQDLYGVWYGMVPPEVRGPGKTFGAEVPCPPDAPTADRLAAHLGRTP